MNVQGSGLMKIPSLELMEGAGVRVLRTIGTPALRNFDPFLLLDHMNGDIPSAYLAGFPSHPHRGFNTFTYMIDGDMEHKDSMGNTGRLGPGGAQWMKAASGVIHSEMPKQEKGVLRGFQLWINLPAKNKMDEPEYQEYRADAFPLITNPDYTVKVLIGEFGESLSPITDPVTDVSYLDVQVKSGKKFTANLKSTYNSFLYLFEGNGFLQGQAVSLYDLVTLNDQISLLEFTAGDGGARFLLISGRPVNESVVQHGPFVMNTIEEIEEAVHDYHSGRLVRIRASVNKIDTHQ